MSDVEPSLKVTLPVGVPMLPVTVAVNVTLWPATMDCVEAPSVVLLTDWNCTFVLVCAAVGVVCTLPALSVAILMKLYVCPLTPL